MHHHVGKSGSIVICITPLTSLMMDQYAKLTSLGLTAAFVGEAQLNPLEKRKVIKGEVQMVYITPENLIGNPVYREMLLSQRYYYSYLFGCLLTLVVVIFVLTIFKYRSSKSINDFQIQMSYYLLLLCNRALHRIDHYSTRILS